MFISILQILSFKSLQGELWKKVSILQSSYFTKNDN